MANPKHITTDAVKRFRKFWADNINEDFGKTDPVDAQILDTVTPEQPVVQMSHNLSNDNLPHSFTFEAFDFQNPDAIAEVEEGLETAKTGLPIDIVSPVNQPESDKPESDKPKTVKKATKAKGSSKK